MIEVTVPQEEVDSQFVRATTAIQKQAELPGFRKGKVPAELVAQKYSHEIREKVLDDLFASSYQEALDQAKCVPIDRPRLEKMELDKGKPLTYQVTVEVLPKVKLGNYSAMKLKKNKVVIQPEEIDRILENLRMQHSTLETVAGRPAQAHDVVMIDFEGKKDNQPVAGTVARDQQMELGVGQMVESFEQGIIGMQVNETKTYPVTFPADYHAAEMAGQVVDFTVTLKNIQNRKLPEMNDEFARQLGKFDNVAALKERIQQDLTADKERQNRTQFHRQIMQELSKSTQVKVPNLLIERSLQNLVHDFETRLTRQHQTWESVKQTPEGYREQHSKQVEEEWKARLALREIAALEQISVADAELDAEVINMAGSMQQNPMVIRKWLDKNDGWDEMRDRLRDEKTMDLIAGKAKITES